MAFEFDELDALEEALEKECAALGVGDVVEGPSVPQESGRERELDILVWGATGYTGRLVCEYLRGRPGMSGISWAAAGRSAKKLEALAGDGVPTRLAEGFEQLSELVASARVVITCAGPYVLCGEEVVRLCVSHGTDYVDVSAEAEWAAEMVEKYDSEARAKGIYIVPLCGMSASNDVGANLAIQALGVPCHSLTGYRWEKGAMAGGALATFLEWQKRGMESKGIASLMNDPFVYGGAPLENGGKPRSQDAFLVNARREPTLKCWLGPASLTKSDTRQVLRSHELYRRAGMAYGSNICVQIFSVLPNEAVAEMVMAQQPPSLANLKAMQAFIQRAEKSREAGMLPKPGEGPSDKVAKRHYCDTLYVAKGDHGAQATCRVTLKDTYEITAISVVESALCMVLERSAMDPARTGFVTPAFALLPGTTYFDRLRAGVLRGNQLHIQANPGKFTQEFGKIHKERFGSMAEGS